MAVINLPEVVFSTPAYPDPTETGAYWSYWGSNGIRGAGGGGFLNQIPMLMANTSGGQNDILTPDTSSFIHADSPGFSGDTAGFTIYTATFQQDSPITLPVNIPAAQGEIRLRFEVTARAPTGSTQLWAHIQNGRVSYGETVNLELQDPDTRPDLTPEWQTYVFNMYYDTDGFDHFDIVDSAFPSFWPRMVTAMAEAKLFFNLTFIGDGAIGTIDIAHVRFGGTITYVSTEIAKGNLVTRQRFGRA